MRRPRAKRGEGAQLRQEILDATEELLDELGDESRISVRKVAERIGRTPPSIYLHFPDKSSLMWAVCARQFTAHDEAMAAAVEGVRDPLERLRAMGRAYVQFAVDHPEEFRILFMTDRSRLGGLQQIRDFEGTPGFALLEGAVAELAAAGHVRADDTFVVALDVWATVHGVAAILVAQPGLDWPEPQAWVERLMDRALHGLLTPVGRRAHPLRPPAG